jgi:hypothetical protein
LKQLRYTTFVDTLPTEEDVHSTTISTCGAVEKWKRERMKAKMRTME